jgi:hypothetical protein
MNPEHIAVDSKGFVYVTEWWYPYNARIQKFDSNGNFVTKWGSYGTGDGQFRWPTGIAVDWTGNVFVSDGMDERIQRFTPVPLIPSGPTNLTAFAESSGAIHLSWEDRSSNETGFLVKRKVGVRGTYFQIAKLDQNVTNFYDVNAIPGSIYFYVVSAYNDKGESAYSNEVYVYSVKLRLISPNGGEVIPAGSNHTISWEVVGTLISPLQYSLEYSLDGGSTWKLIASGITGASYDWNVPIPVGNKTGCFVRVKGFDTGMQVGMDLSDKPFAIEVIRLILPNGGEVLASGSNYLIEWEASGVTNFSLQYSINGGVTWNQIANSISETSYNWAVASPAGNMTRCSVKVNGNDNSGLQIGTDKSDKLFSIEVVKLTSPNGGEIVTSGTTSTITWQTNGTIRPVREVKLYYSTNGGVTWKLIATLGGNPGSYIWTVPSVTKVTNRCRVKLELKDGSAKTIGIDSTDGYFTIQP